jgi:hypothetical protein
MAEQQPRAEFSGTFATKFRQPKRNFVALPRNSAREARWRSEVVSGYCPVGERGSDFALTKHSVRKVLAPAS